ncbi:uracil-DNA glycosylase family protein, partial [Sutterella sp.]|uniref:uracil-DNA glycosylase n=1 Tax=Sutterella sp. TaxID=1981025 RepID=UPI0026E03E9C
KPAPAEAPAPVMPESMIEEIRTADWAKLKELALSCRSCRLCERRSKVVFSEGEPGPKLVIVGEAPGAEEDLQGVPFVGKAGKLLTAMLESLNITRRKDVVILNVLKCRPPNNRDPEPGEIVCCGRYLRRQLEILAPEVILLTGRFSARTVLGLEETMSIGRMRGRVHEARVGDRTIPAVVTYHPSYLLRSPGEKAKSWEDLLLLRDVMEKAGILPPPREKRWT